MTSSLLILAITSANFETLMLGWISVLTVVILAVLGMAAKVLPLAIGLIKQVKDALKGVSTMAAVNEARLDRHREDINQIKEEEK